MGERAAGKKRVVGLEQLREPIQCGVRSAECGIHHRIRLLMMMVMLVMVSGHGAQRLKDLSDGAERDMFTFEQLSQGDIIFDKDEAVPQRQRKVKVSNLPSDASRFFRIGDGDGQQWLRFLGDHVAGSLGLKERFSVLERTLQVKSKLAPICRAAPPASFRQGVPIHDQLDFSQARLKGG
jgi:hypothetical protein